VKSFFKYNDLSLGHIPSGRMRVIYHNRDITRKEIKLIIDASSPRERAYYSMMAQSGLRPGTICKLKYKHIKEDFENNRIPCMIDVPEDIAKGKYHPYFTFIGREGVNHLRGYLSTKPDLQDDDYIFSRQGTNEPSDPRVMSTLFLRRVLKLQKKGMMEVGQKEIGKPHDIRLYSLRKFFRKHAHKAGFEIVQFWMGHTVKAGADEHYRPRDVAWHRNQYKKYAMPELRIDTSSDFEADTKIRELEDYKKSVDTFIQDTFKDMDKLRRDYKALREMAGHSQREREKLEQEVAELKKLLKKKK